MDETPSYMDTSTQKPSKKKTVWLILIIVALIASNVSWALFFFKQQGELTTKNNILLAKVAKLEKENKDLESKSSQASADGEYREIPEVGLRYKLTNGTSNMSYAFTPMSDLSPDDLGLVNFSTLKLMADSYETTETYGDKNETIAYCNIDRIVGISVSVLKPDAEIGPDGQTAKEIFEQGEWKDGLRKLSDDIYIHGGTGAGHGATSFDLVKQPIDGCDKNLIKEAETAGKAVFKLLEVSN